MKIKIVGIIVFFIVNLSAQHEVDSDFEKTKTEHDNHPHHIALFLGGTSFYENGESHFSLGMDYVHRPNAHRPWAFSIFGEAIFAEHTEYIIGLTAYHHFKNRMWLRAGPGIEIVQEEEIAEGKTETKSKSEFLFRFGIGAPFHFGHFSITPSIDIDLVRHNDALVWGLNFGYGF